MGMHATGSVRRDWEVQKGLGSPVRRPRYLGNSVARVTPTKTHPYVADITDVASSTRIRTPSPTRYGTNAPMLWCATNFSSHATVP